MFSIGYHKVTKKIVRASFNIDPPSQALTPQARLVMDCDANDLDINDYVALELPWDKNLRIEFGNHIYNESTGKIEADPNYVAPPPPAPTTPVEPTA